ncbi:c-di-GMP phosphodiesterase [Vibrio parahaemolyticus]|nr:c-di-GMP phosphodiesterase [Vibrio parahaemolyticus]EHU4959255.1 c-di-GMP phosphodiesterase [Vibrio parahaemolyticus]EJG0653457.1 c-di-GMP phosphodiesterase [Vibrio parahaemolyticus]EJG0770492.1 c-di-GMP phosphodiesterase [Vibrio parahaemolyticus]EJG0802555.1 c-di-GMP phosphodiesterase [Vibrio parahaemolyticus]
MAHRSFYPFAKPLNEQLQTLKNRMQAHLPCIDRVSFAKYHPHQDMLKSFAESEFDTWCLAHHEAPFRKLHNLTISAENAIPRIVDDLHDINHCSRIQALLKEGYQSSVAIPCYDNKAFTGFVFLNSVQPQAFKLEALNGLKPYFEMVQFAVESEDHVVHAIETLADRMQGMMPSYSPEYYAHTKRMKYYSQLIATQLADHHHFNDETVEHIGTFAQFHALSDIQLPIEIACSRTRYTREQEAILLQHIEQCIESADDIVARIGNPVHPSVTLFLQMITYQYENLNGSGYPYGLKKEAIPIAAQIVAVVNAFDVLTTHHPYRQAWSIPYALLELEKWVYQGLLSRECVNALREHQNYLKQIIHKYPEHYTGLGLM